MNFTPPKNTSVKPAPAADTGCPHNMPIGWQEIRLVFPPRIRIGFEHFWAAHYPGLASNYVGSIDYANAQVAILQIAMDHLINERRAVDIDSIRQLSPLIKEALSDFKVARDANRDSALDIFKAAKIIQDAEKHRTADNVSWSWPVLCLLITFFFFQFLVICAAIHVCSTKDTQIVPLIQRLQEMEQEKQFPSR